MSSITVQPLTDSDVPHVIAMLAAQDARLTAVDLRMRAPRSREQLAALIAEHRLESLTPLVAYVDGRVRGYVVPRSQDIPSNSIMSAFLAARSGFARSLTLPAPSEPDAEAVCAALLEALDNAWHSQEAGGAMLGWLERDLWFRHLLSAQGFLPDSIVALHPLARLPPARHPRPPGLTARPARPADVETLLALNLEEIEYHLPFTPFWTRSPVFETTLRANLDRLWAGDSVEAGTPIVTVVEHSGEVIAMTESYIEHVSNLEGYLPLGRYGYLNNVGVRADWRGRGVGRVLTEATLAAFEPHAVDAFYLNFLTDNPLSSRFWPHLGFMPLVTRYQRRYQLYH